MEEFLSSGLSINRPDYFRLMILASVDVALTLPAAAFLLYVDVFQAGYPVYWASWGEIHSHFSHVQPVPKSIWSTNKWAVISVYWNQWVFAFTAVVYFLFFGFTQEMRATYWEVFGPIVKVLGCVGAKKETEGSSIIVFENGHGISMALR
jgi:pheromone a factor receptor